LAPAAEKERDREYLAEKFPQRRRSGSRSHNARHFAMPRKQISNSGIRPADYSPSPPPAALAIETDVYDKFVSLSRCRLGPHRRAGSSVKRGFHLRVFFLLFLLFSLLFLAFGNAARQARADPEIARFDPLRSYRITADRFDGKN